MYDAKFEVTPQGPTTFRSPDYFRNGQILMFRKNYRTNVDAIDAKLTDDELGVLTRGYFGGDSIRIVQYLKAGYDRASSVTCREPTAQELAKLCFSIPTTPAELKVTELSIDQAPLGQIGMIRWRGADCGLGVVTKNEAGTHIIQAISHPKGYSWHEGRNIHNYTFRPLRPGEVFTATGKE